MKACQKVRFVTLLVFSFMSSLGVTFIVIIISVFFCSKIVLNFSFTIRPKIIKKRIRFGKSFRVRKWEKFLLQFF